MKYTKFIAASVMLATVSVTSVYAQAIGDNPIPAEFPPSSFTGSQYVDSKGCVFIRAGIYGNVTWVPRVSRDRRQICGAQPSLSGVQTVAAAPVGPQVEQIVPRNVEPVPAVPQPQVTTRPTSQQPMPTVATAIVQPAPAATVRTVTPAAPVAAATVATAVPRTTRAPSPGPEPTLYVNPAPRIAAPVATVSTTAPQAQAVGGCPGASPLSRQYINNGGAFAVRCGPQAESPVTRPAGQASLGSGGGVRILPEHLVTDRAAASRVVVPEGFEPVWDDDRLNPRRGEQSVEGYIQSQYTVTTTVPRRQVGAEGPRRIKQPRILSGPAVRTGRVQIEYAGSAQGSGFSAAPASRAGAAKAELPSAASYPLFVQVGKYQSEAEARADAQRMARTGIPTRMGTMKRGNSTFRLVLAGPFASRAEAQQAANSARAAGFGGAVVLN